MPSGWLAAADLADTLAQLPLTGLRLMLLGCGAHELQTVADALPDRLAQVLCEEPDADHRADADEVALAHGIAFRSLESVPKAATARAFDLLLLSPRHLHSQPRASREARRAERLLRPGGIAVVGCDAAIASAGLAHARRMLSLVIRSTDPMQTQLQLALSLLQVLPPSNWLRRGSAASGLDLTDGYTVHEWLLLPRRTAPMLASHLLRLLHHAGLVPRRPALRCDSRVQDGGRLTGGTRDASLRVRLPSRLWRAACGLGQAECLQLVELLQPDALTHVAIVHRPAATADAGGIVGGKVTDVSLDAALGRALLPPEAANWAPVRQLGAAAQTAVEVEHTREQYETLPFPPRRAADERRRLLRSSLASLSEVAHFLLGGRLHSRFCGASVPPLRVLIAGGGTGDATVQLAVELRDLHAAWPRCQYNRSQIVHLDASRPSVAIARARLEARGLLPRAHARGPGPVHERPAAAVRLVVGSLADPSTLAPLGRFDFVNLCGVLHHVPQPAAVLASLASHSLTAAGGIGLMVYGTIGRTGVYETQAALRLLHAAGNVTDGGRPPRYGSRVADAAELLWHALAPSHPLRANTPIASSHELTLRMGDAGLADVLLSPTDEPYTTPRLRAHAAAAGLRLHGWLTPALYEPQTWLHPCTDAFASCQTAPPLSLLDERIGALDATASEEFAELLAGHARKHWAYLVRSDAPRVAALASPADDDLAPCPTNMSAATLRLLDRHAGRELRLRTDVQGEPLTLTLPPASAALLRRCTCRVPLREVLRAAALETGLALERLRPQWVQLYRALSGIGSLTLSDVWALAAPTYA